jgi:hypothetical protein
MVGEPLILVLPCLRLPATEGVFHGTTGVARLGAVPGVTLLVAHWTFAPAPYIAPGPGPTPIVVRDSWVGMGQLLGSW